MKPLLLFLQLIKSGTCFELAEGRGFHGQASTEPFKSSASADEILQGVQDMTVVSFVTGDVTVN